MEMAVSLEAMLPSSFLCLACLVKISNWYLFFFFNLFFEKLYSCFCCFPLLIPLLVGCGIIIELLFLKYSLVCALRYLKFQLEELVCWLPQYFMIIRGFDAVELQCEILLWLCLYKVLPSISVALFCNYASLGLCIKAFFMYFNFIIPFYVRFFCSWTFASALLPF